MMKEEIDALIKMNNKRGLMITEIFTKLRTIREITHINVKIVGEILTDLIKEGKISVSTKQIMPVDVDIVFSPNFTAEEALKFGITG